MCVTHFERMIEREKKGEKLNNTNGFNIYSNIGYYWGVHYNIARRLKFSVFCFKNKQPEGKYGGARFYTFQLNT